MDHLDETSRHPRRLRQRSEKMPLDNDVDFERFEGVVGHRRDVGGLGEEPLQDLKAGDANLGDDRTAKKSDAENFELPASLQIQRLVDAVFDDKPWKSKIKSFGHELFRIIKHYQLLWLL